MNKASRAVVAVLVILAITLACGISFDLTPAPPAEPTPSESWSPNIIGGPTAPLCNDRANNLAYLALAKPVTQQMADISRSAAGHFRKGDVAGLRKDSANAWSSYRTLTAIKPPGTFVYFHSLLSESVHGFALSVDAAANGDSLTSNKLLDTANTLLKQAFEELQRINAFCGWDTKGGPQG